MKTLVLLLALSVGFVHQGKSNTVKTGEHKSATSTSLSHAQEMELLKDYFPEELSEQQNEHITVQIYSSSFELLMEGKVNSTEETENEELKNYLLQSEFLMNIDDKSLYILEK